MLFHLLGLLTALLLPRGRIRQSGERSLLLTVPISIRLTELFTGQIRFPVISLLFRISQVDPFLRALPAQIREAGQFRRVTTTFRINVLTGM